MNKEKIDRINELARKNKAEGLTPEEIKQMEAKTSKMLNATVVLQNKIDKDLVGGFKIQVDDFVIDQSLKHKLADLKATLLKKGDVIDGN